MAVTRVDAAEKVVMRNGSARCIGRTRAGGEQGNVRKRGGESPETWTGEERKDVGASRPGSAAGHETNSHVFKQLYVYRRGNGASRVSVISGARRYETRVCRSRYRRYATLPPAHSTNRANSREPRRTRPNGSSAAAIESPVGHKSRPVRPPPRVRQAGKYPAAFARREA